MEQFFMPMIMVIVGIMVVLGQTLEDRYFPIFAGFCLALLGIALPVQGLYNLENEFLLLATTTITLGFAAYLILYNGYQLVIEGWGA